MTGPMLVRCTSPPCLYSCIGVLWRGEISFYWLCQSVVGWLLVGWSVCRSVGRTDGWLVCLSDIIPLMGGNVNFQAPIGALVIFWILISPYQLCFTFMCSLFCVFPVPTYHLCFARSSCSQYCSHYGVITSLFTVYQLALTQILLVCTLTASLWLSP